MPYEHYAKVGKWVKFFTDEGDVGYHTHLFSFENGNQIIIQSEMDEVLGFQWRFKLCLKYGDFISHFVFPENQLEECKRAAMKEYQHHIGE